MSGIIFYIPEDVATTPAEGHCYVNRWWTVHPEKGVAFYCSKRSYFPLEPGEEDEPSPQCNSDEHTARILTQRNHPECTVKQIPVVYLRAAIKEMHTQRLAARQPVSQGE